jgi:hypothetical protein
VKTQLIHLDNLGAWLFKGNADRTDLARRLAEDPHVDSWCVQPSYRTRLMAAGQPALLWGSGSRGQVPYGVWGVGRLTGAPAFDGERWRVPLALTALPVERRIARQRLRADPGLADLEVLRQPQAANPSFLTRAQYAVLCEYLSGTAR